MGRGEDDKTVARCTYVDKSAQNDIRASKFQDIFYIRDCYSNNVGLYSDSHGGDNGQEDYVATPEVNQYQDVFLYCHNRGVDTRCKKDLGGPLRTSGISTWAPIVRGANVQSVCKATC